MLMGQLNRITRARLGVFGCGWVICIPVTVGLSSACTCTYHTDGFLILGYM